MNCHRFKNTVQSVKQRFSHEDYKSYLYVKYETLMDALMSYYLWV
jgi:hypothetical protein